MSRGTIIYRGKYFSVYKLKNKSFIYEKGYAKPISSHIKSSTAINKAKALNKKAANLPWWDRE